MRGRAASAPSWDQSDAHQSNTPDAGSASVIKCGACGYYPLRSEPAENSPCINCGYKGSEKPIAGESKNQPDPVKSQPVSIPVPEKVSKPKAATGAKTMRIGQVNLSKESPKPILVLVDENTGTPLEFEGDEISLNRDSLDPGNSSISSAEHAKFHFNNGSWMVEDCSSNSATFIQVKGKVPVENGTFIIVGDKVYRVEMPDADK